MKEKNEIVIKFNRLPEAEDYIFEPFGLHSFTQDEDLKPGDLRIEIKGQNVILPGKLLRFHQSWLNAPTGVKECVAFFYDYIFLDEPDRKEIDTILNLIRNDIVRRRQRPNWQRRK